MDKIVEIYKKEIEKMTKQNNVFMPKIITPKLKWYQKILQILHIKDYRIIKYPKIKTIKVGKKPAIIVGGKNENNRYIK